MYKRINCHILFFFFFFFLVSCEPSDDWKLVWEENFDKEGFIDGKMWSKIPRGNPDWQNYMSDYDSLYDVENGNLILKGMVNPGLSDDHAPYITGGVYTRGKKSFYRGKIEIRARLESARGAWPAFWLLPFDEENGKWPYGGEIDIMERLNGDAIAYQTVHSHYTHHLKQNYPPNGTTAHIEKDDYNIYAVELYADSLVFRINQQHTMTYPRIETDKEGQFPFDRAYYLLLDMQLGGSWVGEVDPGDLPVSMYIDWVRFYEKK
ncbi:MAG: glycoside hydrolase family 16 protein [Bacteroidales bacterium]|jgi:beta-glucanase (GH16 family)|nr:glycoside hydrolase family 16 protein [Bacteroidales bacterium]